MLRVMSVRPSVRNIAAVAGRILVKVSVLKLCQETSEYGCEARQKCRTLDMKSK